MCFLGWCMMLSRRKSPKMGVRTDQREFPGHLAWIRGHMCCVPGCDAQKIEAHHIRKGLPADESGGTSMKPHDKWTVPLCQAHHAEAHNLGADTFDSKYGFRLIDIATEAARLSPHKWRWENKE